MSTHHAIDYIELGVKDLASSKTFYAVAFGWTFNEYGPDYLGIVAPGGEGELGGLNPGREPGRSGPLVLLFSEDLDATAAAIAAAGGTLLRGPIRSRAVAASTSWTRAAMNSAFGRRPESAPPARSPQSIGPAGLIENTAAAKR